MYILEINIIIFVAYAYGLFTVIYIMCGSNSL